MKTEVLEHYSAIARGATTGCCGGGSCGSERIGYTADELAAVPPGADLGLGCGNPQAIAALSPGEVVIDLGAGGGIDCFLAARAVGPGGRVIGVDMSADMIALARANAAKQDVTNVEFRLGEIEHLPVPDASADVVISNCVINLSPDKPAVFRELARVLRPGGRVAVTDVVSFAPLAPELARDVASYCSCIAGAASRDEVIGMLKSAGFADVRVELDAGSREVIAEWAPGSGCEDLVASARITATRAAACCAPGCCA